MDVTNSNKHFFRRISKKELLEEIIKSQEQQYATSKFQILIYSIAHKILRQRRFYRTTWDYKNEAVSECVIKCSNPDTFNKYDVTRDTSCYAYFHQTIKRCIYDTFKKDFYRHYDIRRAVMAWNSCYEELSDPYYDAINEVEENTDELNGKVIKISIEDYLKENK